MKKQDFDGLMPEKTEFKFDEKKLDDMIAKAVMHTQDMPEKQDWRTKVSYGLMAASCATLLYVCSFAPINSNTDVQQFADEGLTEIYDYATLELLEDLV